jgi:predicted AAA+ superfamily ATPase
VVKLLPLSYQEIYSAGASTVSLDAIIYRGFYPRIHMKNLNPTQADSFYCSTYLERDIRALTHVQNLRSFERFLRLCAAQVGQLVNYSRLASDCGINQKTAHQWLSILEASYIVYTLQPHWNNYRKRLTQSPKLYFYDTGLACYLLGIQKEQHVQSHPLRGSLFENFIVSECQKNRANQAQDSNLYFYRDQAGHEVDLIIDQGDQLVSLEIKSGKTLYPDAFKGLKYYHTLAGEKNPQQWLIYGGDEDREHQGCHAFSYKHLPEVFKRLND